MAALTVAGGPAPRRRPRDRRQQILTAAARGFWQLGYHQVGMADIAAAVGIGQSAMYRHFAGKGELLWAVIVDALDWIDAATEGAATGEQLLDALAVCSVRRRELGVLWDRESNHLPRERRREARRRLSELAERIVDSLCARGVPRTEAVLRGWAALAVLQSTSQHRVELDERRYVALLGAAARRVYATALPPRDRTVRPHEPSRPALAPASRREALLAAATRLFGEYGYAAVSLTDIGTAAGIAGPSVYKHFESKEELLSAALARGNEGLWLGLHRALTNADGPDDALRDVVADYADFAVRDPSQITVLVTEMLNLSDEARRRVRRSQREYIEEWASLLRQRDPGLDETGALAAVHAALSVINSLARVHGLHKLPGLTDDLAGMALNVIELEGG